jgi:lactoylglutathione lyase
MIRSVLPNLYCANLARAVAFYRDLLGGVPTFQAPADGPPEHVELRVGDVVIALRPGTGGPMSPTRTATGSPW